MLQDILRSTFLHTSCVTTYTRYFMITNDAGQGGLGTRLVLMHAIIMFMHKSVYQACLLQGTCHCTINVHDNKSNKKAYKKGCSPILTC